MTLLADIECQLEEWGLGHETCDWGGCSNQAVGYADCSHCGGPLYWICQECLDHGGNRFGEPEHRVARFLPFAHASSGEHST